MSEFDDLERALASEIRKASEPTTKAIKEKPAPRAREGFEIELSVYKNNPHDCWVKPYYSLKTFELPAEMEAREHAKSEGLKVQKCVSARRVMIQPK